MIRHQYCRMIDWAHKKNQISICVSTVINYLFFLCGKIEHLGIVILHIRPNWLVWWLFVRLLTHVAQKAAGMVECIEINWAGNLILYTTWNVYVYIYIFYTQILERIGLFLQTSIKSNPRMNK